MSFQETILLALAAVHLLSPRLERVQSVQD